MGPRQEPELAELSVPFVLCCTAITSGRALTSRIADRTTQKLRFDVSIHLISDSGSCEELLFRSGAEPASQVNCIFDSRDYCLADLLM